MKQPVEPRWEERVHMVARRFTYPPTPDLARPVQQQLAERAALPAQSRWLRPALAILLAFVIFIVGMLAVPPVRAALLEWLQIGAVRIWLVEPTATPLPPKAAQLPQPTPTLLPSLFDLAGATTLAAAQEKAGFPLSLPTDPADLGPPDGVYYQEIGGPVVVLVWLDPAQPARARFSLHILGANTFAEKGNATRLAQTTVNGQPAFWTEGPYVLAYRRGTAVDLDVRRLVQGHVLLWTADRLTYRLETTTSLAEAVHMAESLVALPPPALNFVGKTTLAAAQERVPFPIRLPTYPATLEAPDHVFVQQTNGWFVVLLWMEPADLQRVRLVLYEVGPGVGLAKGVPPVLRTTQVNQRPAVWIEGIHYLEHVTNGWSPVRIIDQDVLVWSEEVDGQEITYRLETALPAAQAIAIAESLR